MTLLLFFIGPEEVPPWLLAMAMLCDTAITIAIIIKKV